MDKSIDSTNSSFFLFFFSLFRSVQFNSNNFHLVTSTLNHYMAAAFFYMMNWFHVIFNFRRWKRKKKKNGGTRTHQITVSMYMCEVWFVIILMYIVHCTWDVILWWKREKYHYNYTSMSSGSMVFDGRQHATTCFLCIALIQFTWSLTTRLITS